MANGVFDILALFIGQMALTIIIPLAICAALGHLFGRGPR